MASTKNPSQWTPLQARGLATGRLTTWDGGTTTWDNGLTTWDGTQRQVTDWLPLQE